MWGVSKAMSNLYEGGFYFLFYHLGILLTFQLMQYLDVFFHFLL
jgi:hypothetical protein